MRAITNITWPVALGAVVVLLLSGCGGGTKKSATGPALTPAQTAAAQIATKKREAKVEHELKSEMAGRNAAADLLPGPKKNALLGIQVHDARQGPALALANPLSCSALVAPARAIEQMLSGTGAAGQKRQAALQAYIGNTPNSVQQYFDEVLAAFTAKTRKPTGATSATTNAEAHISAWARSGCKQ